MKSRLLSLLFLMCVSIYSLVHSPADPVIDVGIDHVDLIAAPEAEPEMAVIAYDAVTQPSRHMAMSLPDKVVGEMTVEYTIQSQIADPPRLKDWESPLRYMDKPIDPGSCSATGNSELKDI